MKVILFGGTGMVGQGALRECVADPGVERVLLVVRKASGIKGAKVEELVRHDFFDWSGVEERFAGFDTCLFCLGVSAVGMKEAEYRRTTYDLTLSVARMLERVGSLKTFEYVSGQGTNVMGRQMWARVKGETENALMAMPFERVFCLRPGFIQPLDGIRSKTALYQAVYSVTGWAMPLLKKVAGGVVTTTEELGKVMIRLALDGYSEKVVEMSDIRVVGLRQG